jgi:hypothetical protein
MSNLGSIAARGSIRLTDATPFIKGHLVCMAPAFTTAVFSTAKRSLEGQEQNPGQALWRS